MLLQFLASGYPDVLLQNSVNWLFVLWFGLFVLRFDMNFELSRHFPQSALADNYDTG